MGGYPNCGMNVRIWGKGKPRLGKARGRNTINKLMPRSRCRTPRRADHRPTELPVRQPFALTMPGPAFFSPEPAAGLGPKLELEPMGPVKLPLRETWLAVVNRLPNPVFETDAEVAAVEGVFEPALVPALALVPGRSLDVEGVITGAEWTVAQCALASLIPAMFEFGRAGIE